MTIQKLQIPIQENILFSPIYDLTITEIWNISGQFISNIKVFKYLNSRWTRTDYLTSSTDKLYGNQSYIISLIKKDGSQASFVNLPLDQSRTDFKKSQDIHLNSGYNMIGFYFNYNKDDFITNLGINIKIYKFDNNNNNFVDISTDSNISNLEYNIFYCIYSPINTMNTIYKQCSVGDLRFITGSTTLTTCSSARDRNTCKQTIETINDEKFRCKYVTNDNINYNCSVDYDNKIIAIKSNFCSLNDFKSDCKYTQTCSVDCGRGNKIINVTENDKSTGNGMCEYIDGSNRVNINDNDCEITTGCTVSWGSINNTCFAGGYTDNCTVCFNKTFGDCVNDSGHSCYSGSRNTFLGNQEVNYTDKYRNISTECLNFKANQDRRVNCNLPECLINLSDAGTNGKWYGYCDNWNNSGTTQRVVGNFRSSRPDSTRLLNHWNSTSGDSTSSNCVTQSGTVNCTYVPTEEWRCSYNNNEETQGISQKKYVLDSRVFTTENCSNETWEDYPDKACVTLPGGGQYGAGGYREINSSSPEFLAHSNGLPNYIGCGIDSECQSNSCAIIGTDSQQRYCCPGYATLSFGKRYCTSVGNFFSSSDNRTTCNSRGNFFYNGDKRSDNARGMNSEWYCGTWGTVNPAGVALEVGTLQKGAPRITT